jgi:hypothetical protein
MSKWKIWVGLLVLFLSGVLIGTVGTRMYVRHKISRMYTKERPVIRDLFFRRLTRQLDLSEEQRQEIERIASHAAEEFHTLRRQHRGEAEAILDEAVSEMRQYLSPEQQEQMERIRKRMKTWRKRRRHPPPHPDHPPPPDMRGHLPPPPRPPPPAPPGDPPAP